MKNSEQKKIKGPLDGVRILDLSSVIMGPYATQILGDLGADIIKVEAPCGDNIRHVGPMKNYGMGAIYLHLNRNKRSIKLDLKTPEGLEACLALVKNVDLLIYNIRPQAMERLGLSYEAVKQKNRQIVYVGALGFGSDGPYSGQPAYDDLIQGMTGIADLYQKSSGGVPRYAPLTLADRAIGLQVAIAAIAGIFEAKKSGEGQSIEIPMFEGMAQMVLGDHLGGKTFIPSIAPTGYPRLLANERRPYATEDGFIVLLIYNDKQWRSFFSLIGHFEMTEDPRYKNHQARAENISELYQFVATVIEKRPTAYWLESLKDNDIPAAPLYSVDELIDDPHLQNTQSLPIMDHPTEGKIRTIAPLGNFSKTPLSIRRTAPQLGEHSEEILAELGLSKSHIKALLDKQ